MKKFNLLLVLLICFGFTRQVSFAQNSKPKPDMNYKYKVWLKSNDPALNTIGYIATIDDQNVTMFDLKKTKNISWENIEYLKVRKDGNVVLGTLLGAIAGLGLGYALSDKCESNPNSSGLERSLDGVATFACSVKAIGNSLALGAIGGFIGGGIASIKVNIPINGDSNNGYKIPYKYLSAN